MNVHYDILGAEDLTVAQLCVGVGSDNLVFEPNPGPSLHDRWPAVVTRIARRDITEPVDVLRTAEGLTVCVRNTLCTRTVRFALKLATHASHLAQGAQNHAPKP